MDDAFPPLLHELEAEIMEEAWARDESSVRDVLDALNGRTEVARAYTTVLTVMQRLHTKQMLRRERRGRKHVYLPTITREEYIEARADSQVDALVTEYGDVVLAAFTKRMSALDPKRREKVRKLARRG